MHLDTPQQRDLRERIKHEVDRSLPIFVHMDNDLEAPDIYTDEDGYKTSGAYLGTIDEFVDQIVNAVIRELDI